jgi:hypothetical protein
VRPSTSRASQSDASPALAPDLAEDPFEVLARVVGVGKNVDRVLDRDGPIDCRRRQTFTRRYGGFGGS